MANKNLQLLILYERGDESLFICNCTNGGVKTSAVQRDWAVGNTQQEAINQLQAIHGWDDTNIPPILK